MSDLNYNITFREKDKGWQCIVSYKEKSGKWKQKSKQGFKTKREAKAYSNVIIKDLEKRQGLNKDMEGITLKEFINLFIKHISLYKEKYTINTYTYALSKLDSLYDKEMTKISTLDLQKVFDDLVKQNIKISSIKMIKTRLNYFFNTAIKQYSILKDNPINNVTISSNGRKEEKNALTLTELNNLITKIDDLRFKLFIALGGLCGLRRGEIAGLTWNNINFNNNTLEIDKQWKKTNTGWGLGKCKTLNSYRIVPFNHTVRELLIEYKKTYPVNIDNRIFNFKNLESLSITIVRIIRKEGYNITIHELRHTFATILIQNGVDFKTAAALLGHDVEQTMKIYSHVNDEMLEKAKNIIQNIF